MRGRHGGSTKLRNGNNSARTSRIADWTALIHLHADAERQSLHPPRPRMVRLSNFSSLIWLGRDNGNSLTGPGRLRWEADRTLGAVPRTGAVYHNRTAYNTTDRRNGETVVLPTARPAGRPEVMNTRLGRPTYW